jgi:hypothetical protein
MAVNRKGRPVGRPALVIDPVQVEKLASRWMTKEAIADLLGIGRSTFFEKLREVPEIEEAWHRGRASLQKNSMDWLIASAQNGNVRAQIFLAERVCGLKETVMIEGEVAATYVIELPPEVPLVDWQQTFKPRDHNDPDAVH